MGTIYSCTVLFEGEGDGNCGGAFFWLLGGRLLGVEVFFSYNLEGLWIKQRSKGVVI